MTSTEKLISRVEASIELLNSLNVRIQNLETQTKEVMNFSEAAKYLRVKERVLRDWNTRREIPYSKPGGKVIIYQKADLDKFLSKNKVHSIEQIKSKAATHLQKRA